jgi:putative glutamine amidotransferase
VSRRPTIGITVSVEEMTSGDWTELSDSVPHSYVRAVQQAAGRAVLMVPDPLDAADPAQLLGMVDGLIVSGAAGDVDPARYGASPHPQTRPVVPERDDFELALVRAAAERDVPVLGICRGMHVINVAYGGTLEQHLPDALEHDRHRGPPGRFTHHGVRLADGSRAASAAGARRAEVRSYHHQAVAEVAQPLRPTGWAEGDDVVEAVEDPGRRFLLGVGWHPEEDEASRVIGVLVEEAGR